MPHLLVAGTTGSGKSVCVNALISCFLLHNTPDDLRMIMVDPKRVELSGYDGIPHLLAPVVVDLERVVGVLQWVSREMDQRYHKFSEAGARHIRDYNKKALREGDKKLPYLVVIIDELADLMMLAPTETEKAITRLAQLARATGIHLIISTQRPSTNVVTGLIKANFPARIAFATASGVDSRVILDQPGAETLLGRGDMLFQAPDAAAPVRLQGVFVSDGEIDKLVRYWRFLAAQIKGPVGGTSASGEPDAKMPAIPLKQKEMFEDMKEETERDPLWDEAVELVRMEDRASISMLQRRLRIGYTRAARLIDAMAAEEIIGPATDGPQARKVLDQDPDDPLNKE
jgi:S-DNA-T family DNA segregation ATPase FtsK/SpoIIIE